MDDIRKAITVLKKNSASLKRQSSKFEPMRKPDIIKLRRESLSKIMLSRKTEESRRQQQKASTHTSSPLIVTPKKRKTPDAVNSSPFKLTRIIESPQSAKEKPVEAASVTRHSPQATSTPGSSRAGTSTPSRSVRRLRVESVASSTPSVRVTPPRRAKENSGCQTAASHEGELEGH